MWKRLELRKKQEEEDIHNDYRPMFLFGFKSWLRT